MNLEFPDELIKEFTPVLKWSQWRKDFGCLPYIKTIQGAALVGMCFMYWKNKKVKMEEWICMFKTD